MKTFHIDGAGAGPDGLNSGYAFVYLGTGIQRVRRNDGMTNNQAEYSGLIAVLKYVAAGSQVSIYTDSELVCKQFSGQYATRSQTQTVVGNSPSDCQRKRPPCRSAVDAPRGKLGRKTSGAHVTQAADGGLRNESHKT